MANNQNGLQRNTFMKIGERLYLQSETADVHFIFESNGEHERIPAHKILLSNASDVFHSMFYLLLKETGDIKIADASAETFKLFLRFFYFDHIQLTMENVAELMYLAKKYNVADCMAVCAKFLEEILTYNNAVSFLELAITYDQVELQQLCASEIRDYAVEILDSPSFLTLERKMIDYILQIDDLYCQETKVFDSIMAWVKATSTEAVLTRAIVQTFLGDSFYKIDFSSMSMDKFTEILSTYGNIFSVNEISEVIQTILGKKPRSTMFRKRKSDA